MLKLIAMLASAIPSIIAAMMAFMTRKVATAAGSIAAFIVITVAFIASINTLIGTLATHLVAPSWIGNAVGMFIPSNFGICCAGIVSAHIARAAYDFARDKIKIINAAS